MARLFVIPADQPSSHFGGRPITPPVANGSKEKMCPTCDSPLLLEGNERLGDEVFCGYCGSIYKITAVDVNDGSIEFEDDW